MERSTIELKDITLYRIVGAVYYDTVPALEDKSLRYSIADKINPVFKKANINISSKIRVGSDRIEISDPEKNYKPAFQIGKDGVYFKYTDVKAKSSDIALVSEEMSKILQCILSILDREDWRKVGISYTLVVESIASEEEGTKTVDYLRKDLLNPSLGQFDQLIKEMNLREIDISFTFKQDTKNVNLNIYNSNEQDLAIVFDAKDVRKNVDNELDQYFNDVFGLFSDFCGPYAIKLLQDKEINNVIDVDTLLY